MTEVVITAAAEAEYSEAFCWYAERSLSAAEGFEREFQKALELIGADPERFARCDDRHRRVLMRRYPYQVIYRLEREKVVVAAVAHGKRKPTYWRHR